MATYPTTIKIPRTFTVEIGRITVACAHIEWRLKLTRSEVQGKSPKVARITDKHNQAYNLVDDIISVLRLKGVSLAKEPANLNTLIKHLFVFRDIIVHGAWVDIPGHRFPCLQITRDEDILKKSLGVSGTEKFKTNPIGAQITSAVLKSLADSAEAVSELVDTFCFKATQTLKPEETETLTLALASVASCDSFQVSLGASATASPGHLLPMLATSLYRPKQ